MKSPKSLFQRIPAPLKGKRAIAVAVAILILYFFLNRGAGDLDKITTVNVSREDIKSQVLASGKVTSENSATLHFAVSGKVVWTGVKEGDYVKRGQTIASLDREKYEIALRQAQQDVIAADAALEKVYDDIAHSSADTESIDEKIKRTAAEATKNKAWDAMLGAKRNLKDATLTAPFAGTVNSLNINAGEEIFATTEVVKIADNGSLEFVAEVDETDIPKVKTGQIAQISLDAFEDESFDSEVLSINTQSIQTSTGATAYEVKLKLPKEKNFFLGMSGEGEITVDKKQDVLIIPIEEVIDDKFVYVKQDGEFVKKEVSLGLSSESDAEVTLGLSEGEEIVTGGFDQIGKKSLLQKLFSIF